MLGKLRFYIALCALSISIGRYKELGGCGKFSNISKNFMNVTIFNELRVFYLNVAIKTLFVLYSFRIKAKLMTTNFLEY